MSRKISLPIGNDNFREIRENGQYFIDKSLLINDFYEQMDKVALITRPRRFGKTLNLTMLSEFFDITQASRAIFSGLAIMDTECLAYKLAACGDAERLHWNLFGRSAALFCLCTVQRIQPLC